MEEEIERKCKELLAEGKKYYEVAEILEISDEEVIKKDVSEWRVRYNNRSRWTDEKDKVIRQMLKDDKHPVDIARVVDICPGKIGDRNRRYWKYPVKARRDIGASDREAKIEKEVCRLYELGLSRWLINAELGYRFSTSKSISDIVKKYGYDTSKMNKQILWDEHYFDFIDTEGKAYFLGLICADGWVSRKKGSPTMNIGISLENTDRYIVEKFLKEINCANKIVDKRVPKPKGGTSYNSQIILGSNVMAGALARHGVLERKSGTLEINPNSIPKHLIHHFIRGMIDGDGSIYIGSTANNLNIQMTGTKSVVNFLRYYFWSLDIAEFRDIYFIKKNAIELYDLAYAERNEVKAIYEFLIEDMTIYMARKWNKARDWLKEENLIS